MTDLIADLEAGPGSRKLSDRVLLELGARIDEDKGLFYLHGQIMDAAKRPDPTRSVDDALALVPVTAIQKALISHISSREDVDEVWSFRFMDTAQTMGERAAKEQIKRLHISSEGAAYEVLEKAIADHYLEFFSYDCIEPACAICIAILRAKHGQD